MVNKSLIALALGTVASAISTISVKGSKFFTSDGNQFYVKGKSIATHISYSGCEADNNQALPTSLLLTTRLSTRRNVVRMPHS